MRKWIVLLLLVFIGCVPEKSDTRFNQDGRYFERFEVDGMPCLWVGGYKGGVTCDWTKHDLTIR